MRPTATANCVSYTVVSAMRVLCCLFLQNPVWEGRDKWWKSLSGEQQKAHTVSAQAAAAGELPGLSRLNNSSVV